MLQALRAGPPNEQMLNALEETRQKMGLSAEQSQKIIRQATSQQAASALAVRPALHAAGTYCWTPARQSSLTCSGCCGLLPQQCWR